MRAAAGPTWHSLSVGDRRRLIMTEIGRSALVSLSILLAYFVLPMTGAKGLGGAAWLVGGLVVVTALLVWQVREILRSPYPAATAIGGLAISVPLFLIVFATLYYVMSAQDPDSFSEPLTKLDAVYYTVTVFATVGFGDIAAVSQAARGAATLQMVGGLVLVGVIARVVVGAVQESRRRQGKD
ncbi:MAG TPA: ion channel [Nocardioidaceae bacterium]|nr:ion channel [Nocardioidaceae bacterium]